MSCVSDPPRPGCLEHRESGRARLAAGLAVAGFGVSVGFGLLCPEGVLHFDDLTHYLHAKWAWRWPAYLLDVWGRPGFTALYFLPAKFGWPACRVLSAALSAVSAWLAFRIAQGLGLRHAWAVVVLCYGQPLFFQLSQTTLTETALAFYLTSAVYLAQRGRWSASAAIISIGFITRHEAVVFLPVWIWFAWRGRGALNGGPPDGQPRRGKGLGSAGLWRLWPMVWAPLAVNLLAFAAGRSPAILRLLEPRPSGQYGHGGWLTFFSRSMEAFGPGIMVLAMTGLVATWKKPRGGGLVAACVATYFGAQTAIRALGLFDSGGYARFLVGISPLVAIVALLGWQRLWAVEAGRRRRAVLVAVASMVVLWIAMERQLVLHAAGRDQAAELPEIHRAKIAVRVSTAALVVLSCISAVCASARGAGRHTRGLVPTGLAALMVLGCYGLCHPLWKSEEVRIIEDLTRWLRDNGLGDREVVSAHVWVDFATGRALPPGRPSVREQLRNAPRGTLFAWDRQFASSPGHGLRLEEYTEGETGFRLIHTTRPAPYKNEPYLRVFEKTGP